MASSSSLGNASTTNASSAQAFYTHFRSATDSLLDRLSGDGVTTTPELLQQSLATYASLSAELTAAVDSGVLPSHDQGAHKRRLEEVAAAIEEKRKQIGGGGEGQTQESGRAKRKGAGFVFKRKQAATTTEKPATIVSGNQAKIDTAPGATQTSATKAVEQDRQSTHLTISGKHDARYSHPHSSTSTANTPISIDITNITNSILDLRPLSSQHTILAVQIRSVSHSLLLLPRIEGSVMIHSLAQSLLSIPSCHQFRMHESNDAVVELSTKRGSVVTIEGCSSVTFVTREGEDEVRVQDFDDLINSEQLRQDDGGQSRGNFCVFQCKEGDLAAKIDSLSSAQDSIKDCIEKISSSYKGST